jgi:hypothetical protein
MAPLRRVTSAEAALADFQKYIPFGHAITLCTKGVKILVNEYLVRLANGTL